MIGELNSFAEALDRARCITRAVTHADDAKLSRSMPSTDMPVRSENCGTTVQGEIPEHRFTGVIRR